MKLDNLNKVLEKYYLPKTIDYVLRDRFCDKHMRKFIKDKKILNSKELNIVQLLGFCSSPKCKKAGIVYYIEGEIKYEK